MSRKRLEDLRAKRDRYRATGLGCFLCAWIADDVDRHGKGTDWPLTAEGGGVFPLKGKRRHLAICRE